MKGKHVIGIDAGGTKVAYGLFGGDGEIVDRLRHPTDAAADGPAFSDTMIANVRALMERNGLDFGDINGVGICMPSFILHDEGRILMTSAMPGIKDFPMRDYISERLPVRLALDNDSNAAALAEYLHGAGRGLRHMVYISVSTGLGGGIIIDGKLFHGSYGWAGECGHMLATPGEGIMCGCENSGCYMSYSSGRTLPERVRLGLARGIKSELKPETANGVTLEKALENGDELALEIIEGMAHYIAVCVFNVYQMLNINTFVFGGGLTSLGDALFGRVRERFDSYNHIPLPVHLKIAELKNDIGIIGAVEFLREDSNT